MERYAGFEPATTAWKAVVLAPTPIPHNKGVNAFTLYYHSLLSVVYPCAQLVTSVGGGYEP